MLTTGVVTPSAPVGKVALLSVSGKDCAVKPTEGFVLGQKQSDGISLVSDKSGKAGWITAQGRRARSALRSGRAAQ